MESKNATFQLILTLNKVCKARIQELNSFVLTTTDLAVSHWLHEVCPFPLVARLSGPHFVNTFLSVYFKSAAQALQTTDITVILDNFTRAKKYFMRAKKYFTRVKKYFTEAKKYFT